MLYKARNGAIKLFDDYSSIKGAGLKILTPK